MRRRLPATRWEAHPLHEFLRDIHLGDPETYWHYRQSRAPLFFFSSASRSSYEALLKSWDTNMANPVHEAEEMLQGRFVYFSRHHLAIGIPPLWHHNPFTGQHTPTDKHWSQIGDFGYGDIKLIWELSRFGFVYTLVRAYWRTGDERYAGLFWQLLESWRVSNPPQYGANWKCGQETSFRVMAWCFGLYGFFDAVVTTAARVAMLAQMIAVSGERIEANLDYALSQRNNHGISEGLGLWTIGTLFPEFRSAQRWCERGRTVLEEQGKALIYNDGSFSQHSVNYHRVMLHDYLWAVRLGDVQGRPFSDDLKQRLRKAGQWLYQLQDEITGQTPYYGQNDGALILPLSNCDYLDFRPVVQPVQYLLDGTRCYGDGPWDEDLFWLFGSKAVSAAVDTPLRSDFQADIGGYYTLRSESSFIFVRCGGFRDRPAQADMLHVDLWWRGQNIAIDAGTYSYNAPEPWNNPLACTAYHNTVTVDGLDQMERVGKFVWLPWLQGKVRWNGQSEDHRLMYWEGEHDGYRRLSSPVAYRRGIVRLDDDWWLVLDSLTGARPHEYRLHWLLADYPHEWEEERKTLTLHPPVGDYVMQIGSWGRTGSASLVRADEQSPRGWRAPYYMHREPALSVTLTASAQALLYWTLFGPERGEVSINNGQVSVDTQRGRATITLHERANDSLPLVQQVVVESSTPTL
jgi:hypothetical protein